MTREDTEKTDTDQNGAPPPVSAIPPREAERVEIDKVATKVDVPALWQASSEDLAILKASLVDHDVSDAEFRFFITACRHMNLDPFKRQAHLVKYQGRPVIQTGIDGYRALAVRTGKFDGQDEPVWADLRDGKITLYGPAYVGREVWPFGPDQPPYAAIASVWRKGVSRPFTYVALHKSFVRLVRDRDTQQMRPMALWATMPDIMLYKCALAQALRAAFPDELAGVYTAEEMEQAANDARAPEKGVNAEQRGLLLDALKRSSETDRTRAVEWLRGRGYTGDLAPEKDAKGKVYSPGQRTVAQFMQSVTRPDEVASVVIILKGGEAIIEGEVTELSAEVKV